MAKMIIPRRFVRISSGAGTVSIRKKKSGRFSGRRRVKKGKGDSTNVLRVIRDVDIDKDGKIDAFGGSIIGRSPRRVRVRAGKRRRAFERTI